jgi:hypothetical protein
MEQLELLVSQILVEVYEDQLKQLYPNYQNQDIQRRIN